jgi:hypothetical protein
MLVYFLTGQKEAETVSMQQGRDGTPTLRFPLNETAAAQD